MEPGRQPPPPREPEMPIFDKYQGTTDAEADGLDVGHRR